MFDAGKTRMIGLPYGEKNYDDMLSRFYMIPERHGQMDGQTDGETDRQTGGFAISISRVSMLTRDKNRYFYHILVCPGGAPGVIMLNVVWMEREFDAYK